MSKKSLVTGITGQDGSYMAEYLLDNGYEVWGMNRRKSVPNNDNIAGIIDKIHLAQGDLNDAASIRKLVDMGFDEIYNLGAQSFVKSSFDEPYYTFSSNAVGVLTFLEAIRQGSPHTKFYQASTSEMFGGIDAPPFNEDSKFHPRSPYGVAKLAAYWMVRNYREAYGLRCCSGILFNHESKRRGKVFVTRKICDYVKEYKAACERGEYISPLELGNLEACRDWAHAKDMVRGMHMILTGQDDSKPMKDYVLATGVTRKVRDFIEVAFKLGAGIDIEWVRKDTPESEIGVAQDTKVIVVCINPEFYRPSEVNVLIGDATRARRELRWTPQMSFEDMVQEMLED